MELLKCKLEQSKSKEAKATKELKTMRTQQIEEAKVEVPIKDCQAIIKRHGGAKRKTVPQEKKLVKRKKTVGESSEDESETENTTTTKTPTVIPPAYLPGMAALPAGL